MTQTSNRYPANERDRLGALHRYEILDTPPDGAFDELTQLATYIFNVPIAIISLVDHDRIWFKSRAGVDAQQVDRVPGLCASAILGDDVYVVDDASRDPRTLANPLVTGALGLRFYAAAPLHTTDGYNLGTFCVIDKNPRFFTEQQRSILPALARIVIQQMELSLSMRRHYAHVQAALGEALAELELMRLGDKRDLAAVMAKLDRLKRDIAAGSPSLKT